MISPDNSVSHTATERRILDAAKRVFGRKGLDGARMQEIADEAGLNKALLHYYFRSKDNLFRAVFREVFQSFFPAVLEMMGEEGYSFEEKIRRFVHSYIELIRQHPYLPGFILHHMQGPGEGPERVVDMFRATGVDPGVFYREAKKEAEKGNIRPIDPAQLILNIISLCIFPFIGAPVISVFLFPGKDYDRLLEERKETVSDFVIHAIRKT
ncbi:MAG TPA: TetR/AcrR family transcriptional regulator [Bacteroidetes bacterium]|nr:TetR/AcrR family transcriptional regulator [Bacteroidota bacterium]